MDKIQKYQATESEIDQAMRQGCPEDPSWSMNESMIEDLREFLDFECDLVNILFKPDPIETNWSSERTRHGQDSWITQYFNLIGEITFIFQDESGRNIKVSYEGWHVPLDIKGYELPWPRRLPGKRKVVVKVIFENEQLPPKYTVVSVPFSGDRGGCLMRTGSTPYSRKDECPVWAALSTTLVENEETCLEEEIRKITWQELNFD